MRVSKVIGKRQVDCSKAPIQLERTSRQKKKQQQHEAKKNQTLQPKIYLTFWGVFDFTFAQR